MLVTTDALLATNEMATTASTEFLRKTIWRFWSASNETDDSTVQPERTANFRISTELTSTLKLF